MTAKNSPLSVTAGEGRTEVQLVLIRQGRDWLLAIGGGETHVGAVAVHPVPGDAHEGSGPETIVIPPHKEGPLAEAAAARIARATGRACVAVVGIHQDDITRDEITAIEANVVAGVDRLVAMLQD